MALFFNVETLLFSQQPRPETFRHRLRLLGSSIMTKAKFGETKMVRNHPALTVVLPQEVFRPAMLQVAESNLRKHGQSELGIKLLIDPPEALRIQRP